MARFGVNQAENGRLEIRVSTPEGEIEAFFIPTQTPKEGTPAAERVTAGIKIISFNPKTSLLKIHPINTLAGTDEYLGPKYAQIRTLTVEIPLIDTYLDRSSLDESSLDEILDVLPPGFIKDHSYGLGLLKDCNRLIRLIEEHTECDEIFLANSPGAIVDGAIFRLGLSSFSAIWGEIVRINSRGNRAASRVKDAFVHNKLAAALVLEPSEFSLGRHPVSRVITKAAAGVEELTDQEQDALIGTLASESAVLANTKPEKFLKLQREIELVSLDQLILSYEESLGQGKNEEYWQVFFDNNAFALQQVFGAPMISVRSRATVGGGGFSGSGDKIADYLFKNSLTNNIALVEIKKPTTQLLGATEYRSGVFEASNEINGAVTQVLDQAYQLTTNLSTLKNNSRQWDLESYAVTCFVVAGRTPSADEPAKQKSFELYRANSRSVTIVTYDEILERLKLLRAFLQLDTSPATPER